MGRVYYSLKYRLDGADGYLLWYDGDPDGVVTDHDHRVLTFPDIAALLSWAAANDISVSDEPPVFYDLESLIRWIERPDPDTVDCVAFLNAWNLFTDVRSGVERRNAAWDDPQNDDIYDKLFWGNNLPALTPEGRQYVPIWSADEVTRIAAILNDGLHIFRANLRHINDEENWPGRGGTPPRPGQR